MRVDLQSLDHRITEDRYAASSGRFCNRDFGTRESRAVESTAGESLGPPGNVFPRHGFVAGFLIRAQEFLLPYSGCCEKTLQKNDGNNGRKGKSQTKFPRLSFADLGRRF